jgi:hypothetical protein
LALGACGTAKKVSGYEIVVTNVSVVYSTTRDRTSYIGPYRSQSDIDHFLLIKKFPEFSGLLRDAVVDEFARENVTASFQTVETLPASVSGFTTPHVLTLKVKEVDLTFLDISGALTYQASLYDVPTGRIVWQRDEFVGAGAQSTLDEGKARALARHIVDHLKTEKLLPAKT